LRAFIDDADYGTTFIIDNASLIKVNSTTTATNPPATQPVTTRPPATNPPATNPPATQPVTTRPPATNPPATQPPGTNSGVQPTRANTGPRYPMTNLSVDEFFRTGTCNRQKISGKVEFTPAMRGRTFNLTDCEVTQLVVYTTGGNQPAHTSTSEMVTINLDYVDVPSGLYAMAASIFNADHSYFGGGQIGLKDVWGPFVTQPAPYDIRNSLFYGKYATQPTHTEALHVADYGVGNKFTNVAFVQQGGPLANSGVTATINYHGTNAVFDGCWFLWDGPTPAYYAVYIDGPGNVVKNSWFGSGAGYAYPYPSGKQAIFINNRNVDTGQLINP